MSEQVAKDTERRIQIVRERSTCKECGTEKIGPAALYNGVCAECDHKPRQTVATLREPSEKEIARGDVVSVAFIQCRIDYLLQQHELCGCVGLVDTCDECKKRDFAIRELQACL